jgi:hypothetical protein
MIPADFYFYPIGLSWSHGSHNNKGMADKDKGEIGLSVQTHSMHHRAVLRFYVIELVYIYFLGFMLRELFLYSRAYSYKYSPTISFHYFYVFIVTLGRSQIFLPR